MFQSSSRFFIFLAKKIVAVAMLYGAMMGGVYAANHAKVIKPDNHITLSVGEARLIELSRHAKTAFVAEPKIASFQAPDSRKLLLFGRKQGKTSLFALDDNGKVIYSVSISVGIDVSNVQGLIRHRFPKSNVRIDLTPQGVILKGTVNTAKEANEMVALVENMIPANVFAQSMGSDTQSAQGASGSGGGNSKDKSVGTGKGVGGLKHGHVTNLLTIRQPNQVNVRIRIAEVSKEVKDQFEFTWNLERLDLKDITISDANPFVSVFTDQAKGALGMVDLLAEEKLLNVLAEPNLTVKNGETASFLAGGKLLIPTINGDGAASIEEKSYGVLLQVTPTILSGNRISLKVRPEISDISASNSVKVNGSIIPGIDVRTAETTIELGSGESFALAGMLKTGVTDYVSKIPLLGDLPVIGALFRSQKFANRETELVMVATVYMVEPSEKPLMLPTDNVAIATPFERFVWGTTLKSTDSVPPQKTAVGLGGFNY